MDLRDRYLSELHAFGVDALVKGRRWAHLTSSLIVFDPTLTQVLFTHHR